MKKHELTRMVRKIKAQVMVEYFLLLMLLAGITVFSISSGMLSKVRDAGKTFSQSCVSKIIE